MVMGILGINLWQHQMMMVATRAYRDDTLLMPMVLLLHARAIFGDAMLGIISDYLNTYHLFINSCLINSLLPGGRPT